MHDLAVLPLVIFLFLLQNVESIFSLKRCMNYNTETHGKVFERRGTNYIAAVD